MRVGEAEPYLCTRLLGWRREAEAWRMPADVATSVTSAGRTRKTSNTVMAGSPSISKAILRRFLFLRHSGEMLIGAVTLD